MRLICAGTVLTAAALLSHVPASARLSLPDPRGGETFTMMKFDPNVRGQIYAAAYGTAQAYVSNDNGKNWRLVFDFQKYFENKGVNEQIREIRPGKDPDILFIRPLADVPEGQGIFAVNHKTGEVKHYKMPDVGYDDAWIESFDVYDKEGKIIVADVKYRVNMTSLYSTVYRTDDGGKHWFPISSNYETDYVFPAKVAFSPANPSKLYIFRGNGPAGPNGGILISEDNGQTWHETLPGFSLGTYAFNPRNPDEIYVGTGAMFSDEAVFHSTDGGETWQRVNLAFTPFILNHIIDIAFDAADPNNIIILEEDQIFSTSDNFLNVANVAPAGYYWGTGISVNPFDSDDILIGMDGQGVMRSTTRMQTSELTSRFAFDTDCSDVVANGSEVYSLRDGKCTMAGSDNAIGSGYTFLFADKARDNSVFAYEAKADRLDRISFADSSAITVAKGKGAVAGIATISGGKYAAAMGGSLYILDLSGDTPALSAPSQEGIVAIAADGNTLYAATADKVMTSTDGNSWSDLAPLAGVRNLSAGSGSLAALTDTGLYLLDGDAWSRVENLGFIPAYAAVNGRTIVIREPRPNGLVALRHSKDGGKTWTKSSEKELGFCHADNLCFAPGAEGEVNVFVASSDMGLLSYRADGEPQEDPQPVRPGNTEVRLLRADVTSDATCELSWVSPEGHYNAKYNVYRDFVKVADGITARNFTEEDLTPGEHHWRVTTIYDGTETDGTETAATYTGLKSPVNDARVAVDNLINGDAIALLTWNLPENYAKCSFNIYRDGASVAQNYSGTTYADRDLTGGNHRWEIAAVYKGVESERVSVQADVVNNCSPVRNLDGYFDLDDRQVKLRWDAPGDLPAGWFSRCGEPAEAYGTTELGQHRLEIANHWTAEELEKLGLVGSKVADLCFVPMTEKASYYGRIWIGSDENGQPADEYIFGQIDGKDAVMGQWNILSGTPMEIPEGKDLWIGVGVLYAGGKSPLGIDGGNLTPGQNLIRDWFNIPFSKYEDFDSNARGNFCLGVRMKSKDGNSMKIMAADPQSPVTFEVTRDGETIATTSGLSYAEGNLAERNFTYGVRALHQDRGTSPEESVTVFAGNKCPKPSGLSLSQDKENVNLSWQTSAPQPVPTPLYDEQFNGTEPPADWTLVDKDGDGFNWTVMHYTGPDGQPDPNGFLSSEMSAYDDNGYHPLSPDNWIISPEINITGKNAKLTVMVSAGGMYNNKTYYEVLVSTTGTDPDDFTPLLGEKLELLNMIWVKKVIDLGAYSGKIRIALRHRNENGESMGLFFDSVSMTQEVEKPRLYNVYRDGMSIAEGVSSPAFTDRDCPAGEHTWVVTTVCDEYACESDPLSVKATISNSGIEDITETQGAIYYDARHQAIVAFGKLPSSNIEVYDINGHLVDSVEKADGNKTEIFTFGYRPGVYIAKCGTLAVKLIVE